MLQSFKDDDELYFVFSVAIKVVFFLSQYGLDSFCGYLLLRTLIILEYTTSFCSNKRYFLTRYTVQSAVWISLQIVYRQLINRQV